MRYKQVDSFIYIVEFQSTHSEECDYNGETQTLIGTKFQSTPPKGCDSKIITIVANKKLSIHAPQRVRLCDSVSPILSAPFQSTHSEECDLPITYLMATTICFNPPLPRVRRRYSRSPVRLSTFQSTLLKGCDIYLNLLEPKKKCFNPRTHPR